MFNNIVYTSCRDNFKLKIRDHVQKNLPHCCMTYTLYCNSLSYTINWLNLAAAASCQRLSSRVHLPIDKWQRH